MGTRCTGEFCQVYTAHHDCAGVQKVEIPGLSKRLVYSTLPGMSKRLPTLLSQEGPDQVLAAAWEEKVGT